VGKVDREVLELLWAEARDQRAHAEEMRVRVLANQRRLEEIRHRIAFGSGRAEPPGESVTARS
jgi:HAMP domain-containing protein